MSEVNLAQSNISALSNAELRKLENEIARKHSGMIPWEAVLWAFANLACWLALWPLVLMDIIPLWLGFIIATINMALVYLPTHEAQHYIIGRPGTRWHWLNEFVGHSTSWMMAVPFQVLRITHLEHHKHTNDPELDVDYSLHAEGPVAAIWTAIRQRQPDGQHERKYVQALERANRQDLIDLAGLYKLGYLAILFTLAWSGFALEALCLWWLPLHIGYSYILFFLSWAPHSPGLATGRYRDTRNWRSRLGNVATMGMQFHIVHHLHPYIPLSRTPAAFREMKPVLEARGCQMEM